MGLPLNAKDVSGDQCGQNTYYREGKDDLVSDFTLSFDFFGFGLSFDFFNFWFNLCCFDSRIKLGLGFIFPNLPYRRFPNLNCLNLLTPQFLVEFMNSLDELRR